MHGLVFVCCGQVAAADDDEATERVASEANLKKKRSINKKGKRKKNLLCDARIPVPPAIQFHVAERARK